MLYNCNNCNNAEEIDDSNVFKCVKKDIVITAWSSAEDCEYYE